MKSCININNISIGDDYRPYIIAEMSGNHNGSLKRALEIVKKVADSGAQALKLQTYRADTMTLDISSGEFVISDPKSLWFGKNLYNLYALASTPWEWHSEIFQYAQSLGLAAFSSPFDLTAIDFLEKLNVPAYKIASFENTDWPLLKKIASTGKPIIMSTGATNLIDLAESIQLLKKFGCKELILLKCTSNYPSSPINSNLLTIPHMRQLFNCQVGLSDHTMGIGAPVAAIALGARVIEKHVTLNRSEGGVDSAFSLEPNELKSLVVESERAFQALGNITYDVQTVEIESLKFKRSIYIAKPIKKGEPFSKENLRIIRPGYGLPSKYFDTLLTMKANKDIKAGTPFSWDLI
jgi:N-acetylneuraminate synthase